MRCSRRWREIPAPAEPPAALVMRRFEVNSTLMSHVNTLGLLAMISVPLGIYVLLDLPVTNRWRVAGATLAGLGLVLGVLCASRSALVDSVQR